MAELGKALESVAKGDQAMGMKGYGGDLARMFGLGGHGIGAKGETVPRPPALHSSSQKRGNPNPRSVSARPGKEIKPQRGEGADLVTAEEAGEYLKFSGTMIYEGLRRNSGVQDRRFLAV
jgi:hypothetical protein